MMGLFVFLAVVCSGRTVVIDSTLLFPGSRRAAADTVVLEPSVGDASSVDSVEFRPVVTWTVVSPADSLVSLPEFDIASVPAPFAEGGERFPLFMTLSHIFEKIRNSENQY